MGSSEVVSVVDYRSCVKFCQFSLPDSLHLSLKLPVASPWGLRGAGYPG